MNIEEINTLLKIGAVVVNMAMTPAPPEDVRTLEVWEASVTSLQYYNAPAQHGVTRKEAVEKAWEICRRGTTNGNCAFEYAKKVQITY